MAHGAGSILLSSLGRASWWGDLSPPALAMFVFIFINLLTEPAPFFLRASCSPSSPCHTKGYGLSGSDSGCNGGATPSPEGHPRAEDEAGEAAVTGPGTEVKPVTPSSGHGEAEPLHCWVSAQLGLHSAKGINHVYWATEERNGSLIPFNVVGYM